MRRAGTHRIARIFAFGTLCTATGCWLVAGLEDRTLFDESALDGAPGDGASESDAPASDGTVDGSADGGPVRCRYEDPYGDAGRILKTLSTPGTEGSASLSPNELEIVFRSTWDFGADAAGTGAGAFYYATRGAISEEFVGVSPLSGADEGSQQGFFSQPNTPNAYYTSYDLSTGDPDIFVAPRLAAGKYGAGVLVGPPISTGQPEDYVNQRLDGAELYIGRRLVDGGHVLLLATKSPDAGEFDTATELSTIRNSLDAGSELFAPVISPDGQTLFFAADDPLTLAKRVHQIARGSAVKGEFDPKTIKDLKEMNGGAQQYPVWASPDNCRLYISQRGAGTQFFDIVVYEKKPR